MANELIIATAILVAAIIIAWVLSWKSRKGPRKREIDCPHCSGKMPHDSRTCPNCSKPIRKCATCGAYILEEGGKCEVCGESTSKGPTKVHRCPKCNAPVAADSRKCPKCGEEYWSPIVSEK
jgi:RNA polymerase subunit RPABC4/transcription elongation factor Spt4